MSIPQLDAPASRAPDPSSDREGLIEEVLAKLTHAPDELRAIGAPVAAIKAAEEIARQALRLLAIGRRQ